MLKILYTIIFGLIGSVLAFFAAAASMIFTLGVFWLYIFGDGSWPEWTQFIFGPLPISVFIVVLGFFVVVGFLYGKKKEKETDRQAAVQKAKKKLLAVAAIWILLAVGLFLYASHQRKNLQYSDYAEPLVQITAQGGLCPRGECQSTLVIYTNSKYQQDGITSGHLTTQQMGQLVAAITNANYKQIKERPFTGTCPIAYDGQEVTYTFYITPNRTETISSCQVDINYSEEPFKTIESIRSNL